ncbi:hypothetical protein ABIE44_003716 [Marmoricola sp. OAE513]|uniref:hypothetical protein n=1 Tax=Marmoricola sp. OAE513 TaxID=2817894 RepID=UPI001AE9CCAB
MPVSDQLPYLDTHTVTVAHGPQPVWDAVLRFAADVGFGPRNPFALLLGTEPRSGFTAEVEVPGRVLALTGRHRLARYRLVLEVEPRTEQRTTLLHAHSYAEFPGVPGRAYRALVVGTGLHVLATRGVIRAIASTREK